jgi:hypothetical protein
MAARSGIDPRQHGYQAQHDAHVQMHVVDVQVVKQMMHAQVGPRPEQADR